MQTTQIRSRTRRQQRWDSKSKSRERHWEANAMNGSRTVRILVRRRASVDGKPNGFSNPPALRRRRGNFPTRVGNYTYTHGDSSTPSFGNGRHLIPPRAIGRWSHQRTRRKCSWRTSKLINCTKFPHFDRVRFISRDRACVHETSANHRAQYVRLSTLLQGKRILST